MKLEEIILLDDVARKILGGKPEVKKVQSVSDALIAAMVRSSCTAVQLREILHMREEDRLIDMDQFLNARGKVGSPLEELWPERYRAVATNLIRQRPVGLGTPNAACGEGELFLLFSSPRASKPTKGDIQITSAGKNQKAHLFELKGPGGKISSGVPGKDINENVMRKAKELGILHHIPTSSNSKSRGRPQFIPATKKETLEKVMRDQLGPENSRLLLRAWWEAQTDVSFPADVTWWSDLAPHFVKLCADVTFSDGIAGIIQLGGEPTVYRSPQEVVTAWKSGALGAFEFRAFQNNPAAVYFPD